MAKATFRFYEELNDFLPKRRRRTDAATTFKEKRSIKDAIESLQIQRILDALDITDRVAPFTRCLGCNTLLVMVPKEAVLDRIPPKTRAYCNAYARCPSCDKIYWKGSHYIHMKKVVKQIIDA